MFSSVYDVYEVFQNFFGEAHTDLQLLPSDEDIFSRAMACESVTETTDESGERRLECNDSVINVLKRHYTNLRPFLLVWWPRVTVTNENDRSVEIQDLYAKVEINIEGRIPYESRGFKLCRTTFSEAQFNSGYMHSHVPRFINVPSYENPCLGSGPINNTILDLKNGYEETLWMLFCQELSLYVTVESLSGGPYFRMESIGSEVRLAGFGEYNDASHITAICHNHNRRSDEEMENLKGKIRRFSKYYLQNGHLCLSYKDEKFEVGMPYFDFMVDISNSFISFCNNNDRVEEVHTMYDDDILVKAIVSNGIFYRPGQNTPRDISQFEGTNMFPFKGEMKHLHIERETSREEVEITTLLHHDIAMFILKNVLKIINYRYKNEYTSKLRGSQTAPTYKTVAYL